MPSRIPPQRPRVPSHTAHSCGAARPRGAMHDSAPACSADDATETAVLVVLCLVAAPLFVLTAMYLEIEGLVFG